MVDVGDRLDGNPFRECRYQRGCVLIPTLHTERGLDLASAGLMSSLPSFGMVSSLIAWGRPSIASVSAWCSQRAPP